MNRATVITAGVAMTATGGLVLAVTDTRALIQAGITCLVLGLGCILGGVLSRPGDR